MKQTVIISPFKGCNLEIKGWYTPPEKEIRYYPDGSGHPGSPSEFEIESIESLESDLFDIFEWISSKKDYLEDLQELCIKQIEEQ